MSDEEPVWIGVELEDDSELLVAPNRYVVPATALPLIESGTLVTFGVPGAWWVIDEAYVSSAPWRSNADGTERYWVVPIAEHVSAQLRPHEKVNHEGRPEVLATPRRTEDLWVYRDTPGGRKVTELEDFNSMSWYGRVQTDDLTPPALRRPRPARELPSLIGRRVRIRGRDGTWLWLTAVSEPIEVDASIMVRVLGIFRYGEVLAGASMVAAEPHLVPLHRLWVY